MKPEDHIAAEELAGPEAGQLLEAVLESGADARFRVSGASMAPLIRDGDTVRVRRVAAGDIRVGDVAFCRREDEAGYVMHRVLLRRCIAGRWVLRTKGDALRGLDPPVSEDRVLGRVVEDGAGRNASSKWRALRGLVRVCGYAFRNRLRG